MVPISTSTPSSSAATTTSIIRPTVTVIVTPTPSSTSVPTSSSTLVSTNSSTFNPPFTRTLFVFPSHSTALTSTSTQAPHYTVITRYGTTTSTRMAPLPTSSTVATTSFVRPTVTVIVTPTPTSTPHPVITRTFIVFPSNTTTTVPSTTPVRPTVTVVVVPVPAPKPSTTTSTIAPGTVWVTLRPTSTSSPPITRTFFVPPPPLATSYVTAVISHSITTISPYYYVTTSTAFATIVTTMMAPLPPPTSTPSPSVRLAPVIRSDSTVVVPSLIPTVSVSATTVTRNITLAPIPTVSVLTRTIKTTVTESGQTFVSTVVATRAATKFLTIVTPATVIIQPTVSVSVPTFRNLDATSTSDLLTLTTPPPEPTDVESNSSLVNKGAIAGGVVGGVVGFWLLLGALFLVVRRYRARQNGRAMRIGSSTALEGGMSEPARY
ncbi:hypothetical protein FRC09_012825 [Ceratobasidium sp. 395]|nr:hypothetical protein FRC09_012825 [Ceratobasidium sp. 395]